VLCYYVVVFNCIALNFHSGMVQSKAGLLNLISLFSVYIQEKLFIVFLSVIHCPFYNVKQQKIRECYFLFILFTL
jgi:hypothetical protein